MYHEQVAYIPAMFNIQKSMNVIHHINRMKRMKHITMPIDAERAFDKIRHPFMIKTHSKLRIEGNASTNNL